MLDDVLEEDLPLLFKLKSSLTRSIAEEEACDVVTAVSPCLLEESFEVDPSSADDSALPSADRGVFFVESVGALVAPLRAS